MPQPIPSAQTRSLTDHEHGTNDTPIGSDGSTNFLFGDAFSMFDQAHGGDDTLIGGDNSNNYLPWGRPGTHDNARGGDDTLRGVRITLATRKCTTTPWRQ